MKFIRHIVVGLALLAALICFSVFSTTQYTEEKTNLNSTEDKLPIAGTALNKLDNILSYTEKIPVLNLLSVAKTSSNIETTTITNTLNNPNIKEKIPAQLIDTTKNTIKETNWSELLKKIKETLSKDWSRP